MVLCMSGRQYLGDFEETVVVTGWLRKNHWGANAILVIDGEF